MTKENIPVDYEIEWPSENFREIATGNATFIALGFHVKIEPGNYIRLCETVAGKPSGWYVEGAAGYIEYGAPNGDVLPQIISFKKAWFAKQGLEDERNLYQKYYEERAIYEKPLTAKETAKKKSAKKVK